jgi:hypothetical protein
MPYNQYNAPRKPDIPRLDHDEIVEIIYNKKMVDKIRERKATQLSCFLFLT